MTGILALLTASCVPLGRLSISKLRLFHVMQRKQQYLFDACRPHFRAHLAWHWPCEHAYSHTVLELSSGLRNGLYGVDTVRKYYSATS